jgi:hypothetical protein
MKSSTVDQPTPEEVAVPAPPQSVDTSSHNEPELGQGGHAQVLGVRTETGMGVLPAGLSPQAQENIIASARDDAHIHSSITAMQLEMQWMSDWMHSDKVEMAEQFHEQMCSIKGELKEIQSKQDVATASLTSMGEDLTELRTTGSPDSVSGLRSSTR